ncbi:MAG: hypothetical protein PHW00_01380 [Clostridia bacterium]|nr:hypothetical protein [Clostridia bacterium]
MTESVDQIRSRIKLENERSTHVQKRLNRLTTWQFFKVLYRDGFIRMFLTNILMIVCLVPAIVAYVFMFNEIGVLGITMPVNNGLGIGSGAWLSVNQHYDQLALAINTEYTLWLCLGLLGVAFALSGAFAVVRDAFWTGKLKVFKPFFSGIASSIGYSLSGMLVLVAMYFGIFCLRAYVHPTWLAIVLVVLGCIVMALTALYVFTLIAVSGTYKQSVVKNLSVSWQLMWVNTLPNLFNFLICFLPVILAVLLMTVQMIGTLILAFMFILGMYYIAHVWMTHMMRTFAFFNPVPRKKNGVPTGQQPAVNTPLPSREGNVEN